MATITAPIRSTPSLTVAPTQNTAPVFEYRCLYTHDLRKKKKTWHDGSLRFHTFNRRVMVYDDAKNYIGDHHQRESDCVNEGDELKLDKGVLVEIGEQIGRTETDLAPILEKAHPQRSSSPARAPLRQFPPINNSRTGAFSSQGRPRSIADVLGASQGRIGRARLPVQSPYEQRQQSLNLVNVHGPPLKKRKVDDGKENTRPSYRQAIDTPSKTERPAVKAVPPSTPQNQAQKKLPVAGDIRDVIEISSEFGAEPSQSSEVPTPKQPIRQIQYPRPSQPTASAPVVEPPSKVGQESLSHQRPNSPRRPRNSRLVATPPQVTTKPTSRSNLDSSKCTASSVEESSTRRGTGRLYFATSQPRVKLVYPMLLAARSSKSVLQSPPRPAKGLGANGPDGQDEVPTSRRRRSTRHLQLDSSSDVEGDKELETDSAQPRAAVRKRTTPAASATGGSSPLFCPATPTSNNHDTLQQTPILDDMDISPIPNLDFDTPKPQSSPIQTPLDQAAKHTEEEGALPRCQIPPSKLTMMDRQLLAPVVKPQAPIIDSILRRSPGNSNLRRTQSENDANKVEELHPKCHLEMDKQPTLPREKCEPARLPGNPGQKPFKSPRKLQKSVSDLTLNSTTTRQLSRTASGTSDDQEEERGPWTKAEAFDLFPVWPLERDKPVYKSIESDEPEPGGFISDKLDAL